MHARPPSQRTWVPLSSFPVPQLILFTHCFSIYMPDSPAMRTNAGAALRRGSYLDKVLRVVRVELGGCSLGHGSAVVSVEFEVGAREVSEIRPSQWV